MIHRSFAEIYSGSRRRLFVFADTNPIIHALLLPTASNALQRQAVEDNNMIYLASVAVAVVAGGKRREESSLHLCAVVMGACLCSRDRVPHLHTSPQGPCHPLCPSAIFHSSILHFHNHTVSFKLLIFYFINYSLRYHAPPNLQMRLS